MAEKERDTAETPEGARAIIKRLTVGAAYAAARSAEQHDGIVECKVALAVGRQARAMAALTRTLDLIVRSEAAADAAPASVENEAIEHEEGDDEDAAERARLEALPLDELCAVVEQRIGRFEPYAPVAALAEVGTEDRPSAQRAATAGVGVAGEGRAGPVAEAGRLVDVAVPGWAGRGQDPGGSRMARAARF